jgi:clan AA aspartic protease
MTGEVTPDREAVVRVRILGTGGSIELRAAVDTGFNGYLTLPQATVTSLGLRSAGSRRASLADDRELYLPAYLAEVEWNRGTREVVCLATEGGVLIGMSMLYGQRLTIDVVDGGPVKIEPLSP